MIISVIIIIRNIYNLFVCRWIHLHENGLKIIPFADGMSNWMNRPQTSNSNVDEVRARARVDTCSCEINWSASKGMSVQVDWTAWLDALKNCRVYFYFNKINRSLFLYKNKIKCMKKINKTNRMRLFLRNPYQDGHNRQPY